MLHPRNGCVSMSTGRMASFLICSPPKPGGHLSNQTILGVIPYRPGRSDAHRGPNMTSHDTNDLTPEMIAGRFDLLVAGAIEYALFLLDVDGKVICWNLGAERLFGFRT